MKRRLIIALLISGCWGIVLYLSTPFELATTFPMKAHYIQNAYLETGAVNVVTAIYLNYRYFDTLFEALMLLFSIIGVIYMSVHEGSDPDE